MTDFHPDFWPIYNAPEQVVKDWKDNRTVASTKYPFSRLEPGQCFLIKENIKKLQNMQTLCSYHGKKLGRVFKCGYDTVSETKDIIVWRES